jgi:hypothetical protein
MRVTIKCDQMIEEWNYDTCFECRHFSISITDKGRKWSCSLNNRFAAEKRDFYLIWATNYLIESGYLNKNCQNNIIIDYIGKKKRNKKGLK